MSVNIHSSEDYQELLAAVEPGQRAEDIARQTFRHQRKGTVDGATSHEEQLRQKKLSMLKAEYEQRQREDEHRIKERMAAVEARRSVAFDKHFNNVLLGRELAEELRKSTNLNEEEDLRRRREEHERWEDNVYRKLRDSINSHVEGMDQKKLRDKKNQEYEKFLSISNQKGGVFGDIVIESEYDPFESNRGGIKIKHGELRDPTRRCLDRRLEEREEDIAKVERTSRTKETLDVKLWSTGKIESTPHGFHAQCGLQGDGQDSCGSRKQPSKTSKRNDSRVCIVHDPSLKGKEITDAEFPSGKRVFPAASKQEPIA